MEFVFFSQILKIIESGHPDIWCVVPLKRQVFGDRHAPFEHTQSIGPMGKIGKCDNPHLTHPRGLFEHGLGVFQVLKGVNLQHHIKRLVLKQLEPFFQIELQNIDVSLKAGCHVGIV